MLDTTRWSVCAEDLDQIKDHPQEADPARWIPLLVAEVERLRERLKALETEVARHHRDQA